MAIREQLIGLLILVATCAATPIGSTSTCSCSDSKLCGPLDSRSNRFEFIGFLLDQSPSIYKLLDWSKVTTLVINAIGTDTSAFVCYAHARNVRVTFLTSISTADLASSTLRKAYISKVIKIVKSNNLDGVNMDFEGNIYVNTTDYHDLTFLMRDLRAALLTQNANYSLSMDYVYCAECITGRTYDYKKILQYVDYFIIMEYDMQGRRYERIGDSGTCSVLANSPFPVVSYFGQDFLVHGIPSSKLVLAFPWYGYKDKCSSFDRRTQTCYTPCSNVDSGSLQFRYSQIMTDLRSASMEGRQWNGESLTPTVSYIDSNGVVYQYNYDDPWSLRMKYVYAASMNMRGVGTWHVTCLDFSNSLQAQADRQLMWDAIPILNRTTSFGSRN